MTATHPTASPYGCRDCGAGADAPCDPACPSAAAAQEVEEDRIEAEAASRPCHPDPVSAARALCGCW